MTNKPSGRYINSNEFAEGPFKPHGYSHLFAENEIVRIETEGPFNLEAILAINKSREHMMQSAVARRPYVYLNQWRTSAMMPMDALREYGNGLRRAYAAKENAPKAVAWIFPEDIEGGQMMRGHYEALFADVGIPFGIFPTEADALAWVVLKLNPGTT